MDDLPLRGVSFTDILNQVSKHAAQMSLEFPQKASDLAQKKIKALRTHLSKQLSLKKSGMSCHS